MNSDQIKAKFGNYHIQVLRQNERTRVANLYTEHDEIKICRTLAVTRFSQPTAEPLLLVDEIIRQGNSIGTTLIRQGFKVTKELAAEAVTYAGRKFEELCCNSIDSRALICVGLYQLNVSASDGQNRLYATIAEAHHPEYISPSEGLPFACSLKWRENQAEARVALSALLAEIG